MTKNKNPGSSISAFKFELISFEFLITNCLLFLSENNVIYNPEQTDIQLVGQNSSETLNSVLSNSNIFIDTNVSSSILE